MSDKTDTVSVFTSAPAEPVASAAVAEECAPAPERPWEPGCYGVQAFGEKGERDLAAESVAFPTGYTPSSEPDAVKACLDANERHSLGAWFGVVHIPVSA